MGVSATMKIEAYLSGAWVDLTGDSIENKGLRIHYGINGNRPTDVIAGTGECSFWLNNMASAGGRPQGYYSPSHASVRSGWTYGVRSRVVFTSGASTVFSAGITRSGSTATVTTVGSHGRAVGEWVTIAGADQSEYNGTFQVTAVGGSTTFDVTVTGTPTTPATGTITSVQSFVKGTGRVQVIDPEAGRYDTQRVRVIAYDVMNDLAENDVRSISTQQNKTEAQLIQSVLSAVPSEAQPVATDLDTGIDTFTVAFDDVGGGTKAATVIGNVARSAMALVTVNGDGTFRMRSRHGRVIGASLFSFDDTMRGFSVPSSLDGVYNLVRTINHPKAIDSAATTVLYAQSGPALYVAPGQTIETWGSYTDPADRQTPIGGVSGSFVDPLVASTDYLGNDQEDGLGSDRTSDLSISVTPFSASCLFSITNTSATGLYVTKRQIRGKGIYDQAPQTFEASSTQAYGVRPVTIDLHYQDDPDIAQSAATFIEAQYRSLVSQPSSMTFFANNSSDLMAAALGAEPGDRVTVTETVTGTTLVDVIIHSVDLSVSVGNWITCTWGLAPASPWAFWQLGLAGASELGATTTLGF